MNINKRSTIIITIRDKKYMRKGVEIAWVEARIVLSLERKRLYRTIICVSNQIICVSLSRYNNPSNRSSAAKDLRTL